MNIIPNNILVDVCKKGIPLKRIDIKITINVYVFFCKFNCILLNNTDIPFPCIFYKFTKTAKSFNG